MMPIRSVAMRVSVADVKIVNCLGAGAICVRDYQVAGGEVNWLIDGRCQPSTLPMLI